jgi:hypothetical protein
MNTCPPEPGGSGLHAAYRSATHRRRCQPADPGFSNLISNAEQAICEVRESDGSRSPHVRERNVIATVCRTTASEFRLRPALPFDPFTRRSGLGGGTGLGLSICPRSPASTAAQFRQNPCGRRLAFRLASASGCRWTGAITCNIRL